MIPPLFASIDPDAASVFIPLWLDFAAVIVGCFSGILVAEERDLDLVGFVGLSMMGGLGGGLVRDVIMQVGDVYMLTSPLAIPGCVVAALVAFLFSGNLHRFPHLLAWTDIVSVGLFVCAGTDKAILYGLSPWACVLMGTLTGVGGGMMRDVLLGDVPKIFRRSNLYAICAVMGAALYFVLVSILTINKPWAALASVVAIVVLRSWSVRYNVLSPAGVDLTPEV
jgi:uncharacterized membrane protein YeiH